ncbi:MAG: glycoside hydrolase family protein [Bacteroidia bacterium]|nr:glycoside hydrolase family protein [Bacteroidia bacterium]
MKIKILSVLFFSISLLSSAAIQPINNVDNLNLTEKIVPITASAIFRDSLYYQWCSSIIKDEKGIYHLFYSRWPKKVGFNGWLTHSEIALATATSLGGPYTYKETVLKRQAGNKNFICFHNPKIKKFGKKYYLYFISTNNGNDELSEDTLASIAKNGGKNKYWSALRNNQRTYVAVSNGLNGTWKMVDKPLLEPSFPIAHVTVNPDVEQDENGTYFLVVKGDKVNSEKWKLIQVIATSKSPLGPFLIQPKPMFDEISTEDVSIWRDQNNRQFYAIFHAHGGNFIGLLTSPDGLNWVKATNYEVCKKEIRFNDGTVLKPDRMERPFVFQENGVPASLSFGVKQGDDAYIVFIPLLGSNRYSK